MRAFDAIRPGSELETPLVVEVPHAGVHVPAECLALLEIPARSLAEDADLYVDQLYVDAPALGASLLVCHLSRYVVDMNRSELDVDGLAVSGVKSQHAAVRGVVWRESGRGDRVLARPLSGDELLARLRAYHRPYHAALQTLIAEKKAKFGYCIVLAAHSMPSRTDRMGEVADVVPGTRGRTSAGAAVIECVERVTAAHGLSLRHDAPYRGGYTTGHYGRPSDRVHVVQIELARRLYMDEKTLLPNAQPPLRAYCATLMRELGALRL